MELMPGKKILMKNLLLLPEEIILPKTKEKVILDLFENADYESIYEMLKDAVEEGVNYPRETIDRENFESYYLSKDLFVMRDYSRKEILGLFYLKPNFPGRSSHICNGGFLVNKNSRQKGVGEILYKKYLMIAKKLGYKASLFNIVYATNKAAIKICLKLGFIEIGRIPNAGKLKGLGYVDALQFYYDLTTLKSHV